MSTPESPHPLLESRGPPRGPGRPSPGMERGGADRGALPVPEVAVSGHHIWDGSASLALAKGGTWEGKERLPGVGTPVLHL